jgi:putative flippase GtrA
MYIFSKFFLVGVLNTALDFAVLNTCLFLFGTGAHGELFVVFKSISFFAAVTNSYLLNKYWVFEHSATPATKEFITFLVISVAGFVINVSVSFGTYTLFAHELSPSIAANIGALMGTFIVFAWNFIGYRFFVFNKSHGQ